MHAEITKITMVDNSIFLKSAGSISFLIALFQILSEVTLFFDFQRESLGI